MKNQLFVLLICGASWAHGAQIAQHWTFGEDTGPDGLPSERPLIVAHRGASGMYPEHTKLAYEEAKKQGADVVECDVTITKNLDLVCSHEPWIDEVANVGHFANEGPAHPDFSDKRHTYDLNDADLNVNWNDKGTVQGYFTWDFELSELQQLSRRQARDYRDDKYDWKYTFVTFEEYLNMSRTLGFGVYPEIKLAYATNKILRERGHNVTLEQLVLKKLAEFGYHNAGDPCFIQTFELSILRSLREANTDLRLIMLVDKPEKVTNESLAIYKELGAYGIGVDKDLIVYKDETGHIENTDTGLIRRIKEYGFKIHVYTFRNEPRHLVWDYGQDSYVEMQKYLSLGIDGYFTDFPGSLRNFLAYEKAAAAGSGRTWASLGLVLLLPVVVFKIGF